MNISVWQEIDNYFRNGKISEAGDYLESLLRAEQSNRFVSLCHLRFTNSHESIVRHVESLMELCIPRFPVRAVYVEMNGFDINYDRWYFDSFAYDNYESDPDDLEWLCEWKSPEFPQFTLTGLEEVQNDFRWYMQNDIYNKHTHEMAQEYAVLLVMTRFVQLIGESLAAHPVLVPVPVLATAHDFDILGRFEPIV
jgi:hypothetical protein